MFGYVKPVVSELLVKEHELYRATYCGICRAMKKHTGVFSNMLHSYDSVMLALIRMLYVDKDKISATKRRCIAHPMAKRPMLDANEALEYTARAFGILTYYKLCDDSSDEKLPKRVLVSLVKPVFRHAKRRASLQYLADIAKDRLFKISELEEQKCPSVDMPAACFGELLGEIFAYGIESSDRKALYAIGYHLGKFIYAADAAEDYAKDKKSGSYNPYVIMYGGEELTPENKSTIKCALLMECRSLEAAVGLLPFGSNVSIENIVNNIIYLGLPSRLSFLDTEAEGKERRNNE